MFVFSALLLVGVVAAAMGTVAVFRGQNAVDPDPAILKRDSVVLLVVGVTFVLLGPMLAVMGVVAGYGWLPVGIVFLGVGGRMRQKSQRSGTEQFSDG